MRHGGVLVLCCLRVRPVTTILSRAFRPRLCCVQCALLLHSLQSRIVKPELALLVAVPRLALCTEQAGHAFRVLMSTHMYWLGTRGQSGAAQQAK